MYIYMKLMPKLGYELQADVHLDPTMFFVLGHIEPCSPTSSLSCVETNGNETLIRNMT